MAESVLFVHITVTLCRASLALRHLEIRARRAFLDPNDSAYLPRSGGNSGNDFGEGSSAPRLFRGGLRSNGHWEVNALPVLVLPALPLPQATKSLNPGLWNSTYHQTSHPHSSSTSLLQPFRPHATTTFPEFHRGIDTFPRRLPSLVKSNSSDLSWVPRPRALPAVSGNRRIRRPPARLAARPQPRPRPRQRQRAQARPRPQRSPSTTQRQQRQQQPSEHRRKNTLSPTISCGVD